MKLLKQVLLFFLITSSSSVFGARSLYKNLKDNYGEIILDSSNLKPGSNGNAYIYQAKKLMPDFRYFDKAESQINVHFNGFVTFSFDAISAVTKLKCQKGPSNTDDLIPIYWANYDFGKVYQFKHSKQRPELSSMQIKSLARDLDQTFGDRNNGLPITHRDRITTDQIQEVLVFTWYDMYARINTRTLQRKRHRFQMLIAQVENEGKRYFYVQVYYAQLDSNGNWDPVVTFKDQQCKQAQLGVGVATFAKSNFNGVYNPGFPLPAIAECITNEYPYTDLGSWIFDISDKQVTNQPVPPSGRCDSKFGSLDPKCYLKGFAEKKREDMKGVVGSSVAPGTIPPTTKTTTVVPTKTIKTTTKTAPTKPTEITEITRPTTTTTTTPSTTSTQTTRTTPVVVTTEGIVDEKVRRLANKFCKNRDAGLFQLPVICDVFVSCSLGKEAEPMVCPEGTNFNPEFQTCDHSDNFECFYDNVTLTELTNVTAPPPKHNNLCHFLGWGDYVDPNSCSNYYACTNSRSILMPCPAGLYFKPLTESSGICDWVRNVKCSGEGQRPPTTTYHPRNVGQR